MITVPSESTAYVAVQTAKCVSMQISQYVDNDLLKRTSFVALCSVIRRDLCATQTVQRQHGTTLDFGMPSEV